MELRLQIEKDFVFQQQQLWVQHLARPLPVQLPRSSTSRSSGISTSETFATSSTVSKTTTAPPLTEEGIDPTDDTDDTDAVIGRSEGESDNSTKGSPVDVLQSTSSSLARTSETSTVKPTAASTASSKSEVLCKGTPIAGSNGTCLPGPRGPSGLPGPQGEKGDSIVGPRGQTGYQGYPGRNGAKGSKGTAGGEDLKVSEDGRVALDQHYSLMPSEEVITVKEREGLTGPPESREKPGVILDPVTGLPVNPSKGDQGDPGIDGLEGKKGEHGGKGQRGINWSAWSEGKLSYLILDVYIVPTFHMKGCASRNLKQKTFDDCKL
ncbi:hypothetical protein OS493_032350 [Desmophyllum pertusum]|uniref:Uncharacterized protein n=1 Tax=Desmophyllum pertusum TaxID=174260 RepID=A0A9W9YJC8_9CNID|nr:hypothetical protein OS493_032350 [Desmophyllum pertusum]